MFNKIRITKQFVKYFLFITFTVFIILLTIKFYYIHIYSNSYISNVFNKHFTIFETLIYNKEFEKVYEVLSDNSLVYNYYNKDNYYRVYEIMNKFYKGFIICEIERYTLYHNNKNFDIISANIYKKAKIDNIDRYFTAIT
jgi:hypothetical protein